MKDNVDRIDDALIQLEQLDSYLLENNAHERAICCRLAMYIQMQFPDYNVDCEYNLDCDNDSLRKQLFVLEQELQSFRTRVGNETEFSEQRRIGYSMSVYPDIIVHRRGTNKFNLIAIELKKAASFREAEYDRYKLSKYTADDDFGLRYRMGVLIDLDLRHPSGPIRKEFFVNGRMVTLEAL